MAQWVTKLKGLMGVTSAVAPTARNVAKERLSIILKHQRGLEALSKVDMQQLQAEVIQCVKKYITVAENRPVNMSVKSEGDDEIFEIQLTLATERQL